MTTNALAARRPRSVWVLAATFGVVVGTFVGVSQVDGVTFDLGDTVTFGLASLLFTGLGGLILTRVPGNRIGWVISLAGLTLSASAIPQKLSDVGVTAVLGIGSALWISTFALLGFLMLWFPSGRTPTRRWLWLEWLGYLVLGASLFLSLFSERFCTDGDGRRCLTSVENPVGIAGLRDLEYGAPAIFGVFALFFLSSALSLIVRFVRSRGVERLQLKWLTFSVAMLVGWIVVEPVANAMGLGALSNSVAGEVIFGLLFLGVPVSAVLAVLRYRLYDIDRIISRTVSYAVVLGLLAAVYVVATTVLARSLPVESNLAVAGSTLAVVALFAPLRRRVQNVVDRRFNRTKYTADLEMSAFAHRVRDTTDLAAIEGDVRSVIDRTLQPMVTGIWINTKSA